MNEWFMILLLSAGPLLWMWGGTGWKPARRFLWPVLVGVIILPLLPVWRMGLCIASMMVVNSLGYGEGRSWLMRGLICTGLMACAWWISLVFWWVGVLFGVGLTAWMWLSRRDNRWTWKTWEAMAGLLQAVSVVTAAQAHG